MSLKGKYEVRILRTDIGIKDVDCDCSSCLADVRIMAGSTGIPLHSIQWVNATVIDIQAI